MKYETINYNIHDLLRFKIIQNKAKSLIKDINLPYSYFETKKLKSPDVILKIGDFKPQNNNCHIIDHKWYIKYNYIYMRDNIGKINFHFEISDLEANPTIINFKSNIKKIKQLLYPSLLAQQLVLRDVLNLKLINKGVLPLHAAAVSNTDGAKIFLGRGGTFKTTLCMDYVRNLRYNFLGDDKILLKRNNVFSFVLHPDLFNYRIKKMPTEHYSFLDKYKYSVYQNIKKDITQHKKIESEATVSSVYFLVKTNANHIKIIGKNKNETIKRIINSQKMESMNGPVYMGVSKGLYDCFLAYSYIFPKSIIAKYWDLYVSLLHEFLEDKKYYEICLPKRYTKNRFKQFVETLESL